MLDPTMPPPAASPAPAMVIDGVSKRYRRLPQQGFATTLKSFLLRDAWRREAAAEPQDGSLWALRDVSLRFERGRTVGIVGRNGSGKSTLLKLMGRILRPDLGQVHLAGRVAALIELGAGFHPELTGRENVLINGVILGLSKREVRERMDAIIRFAAIGEALEYPVRTYSSGMHARLGFAVAMHVEPDILLIDEILSVGDASFTRRCHEALNAFKARGCCIVVVSHSLDTVRTWCDDAIWIDRGQVRGQGPAGEVVDTYERLSREEDEAGLTAP